MKELAAKHLPKYDRGYRSVISLYDGLIAKAVVPTKDRAKLEELSRIRNSVVHAPAVPEADELRRYIEMIDFLIDKLPNE